MSDNTATNYVWETVSGDRGTINTSGTISITQKWGALRYEIIHLEDEKGRELNFVVRVNYRDPNKQFTIEQQVADFSYIDYVDLGRGLNLIVKVNYRDPSKPFTIDYQGGDATYNDYVYLSVAKRDAVGDVSFSYKVIETNDPKGADGIVFTEEKYSTYTVKVSNLDRTKYYYVVEITGVDEAGNVAKDTARIEVKS